MAAADKPKVYYFDSPGRAEIARQMLTYLGKEFDDVRFNREEWLSTYKAQAPLGMAPFYEEGGVKLGGSAAIGRYIAENNGLGGRNALENAQLESYVDATFDLGSKLYGIIMGPEDKRDECKKEFLKDVPGKLSFLEKQVKSEKHFLSGNKISWADFNFSIFHYGVCKLGLGDVFNDCPKLAAVAKNISEMEKIKEWRTKTYKMPPK